MKEEERKREGMMKKGKGWEGREKKRKENSLKLNIIFDMCL